MGKNQRPLTKIEEYECRFPFKDKISFALTCYVDASSRDVEKLLFWLFRQNQPYPSNYLGVSYGSVSRALNIPELQALRLILTKMRFAEKNMNYGTKINEKLKTVTRIREKELKKLLNYEKKRVKK